MAKKAESLSEQLQALFADPIGNYDAIAAAIRSQHERLIDIRDAAQESLEWLTVLKGALLENVLKSKAK